jgi:IS30 family transposase
MSEDGMTQQEIADAVGTTQSTVSHEFKRNTGERGYRHKQAQSNAEKRRQSVTKSLKMTDSMIVKVEQKLSQKWSSEQISGWLCEELGEQLSHKRSYQHIWADKRAGGELNRYALRS